MTKKLTPKQKAWNATKRANRRTSAKTVLARRNLVVVPNRTARRSA